MVVHLAHKRAHLHRVLVLMVQAVRLEEAEEPEQSHERTESDANVFLCNNSGRTHASKVTHLMQMLSESNDIRMKITSC